MEEFKKPVYVTYVDPTPWYVVTLQHHRERERINRDDLGNYQMTSIFKRSNKDRIKNVNAEVIMGKIKNYDFVLTIYEHSFLGLEAEEVFPGLYYLPMLPTVDESIAHFRWWPDILNDHHPKEYFKIHQLKKEKSKRLLELEELNEMTF